MRRHTLYAFTLVELMIVIGIIAILAGILVPNFMRARQEAQLASCKQNILTYVKAIEMALIRPEATFRHVYRTPDGVAMVADDNYLFEAGYLKSRPICPASGSNSYSITYQSNGEYYIACQSDAHCSLGLPVCHPAYSTLKDGKTGWQGDY